tara:strand:- start:148 stop:885 length:738 start_codon:yes stop_codon:yes gene_type:complete
MKLPSKPQEVENVDPIRMIIAGAPKVGKTKITSELTLGGKWIILDLENGSAFLKNTRVSISSPADLLEFGEAVVEAGYPYEGIIVDSLTILERFAKEVGTENYRASLIGSTWAGDDILDLPRGAGYSVLRKAFLEMISFIETLSPRTIYLGHLKASTIGEDEDAITALHVDLLGKSGKILASQCDTIAFCKRSEEGDTVLDFQTSDEMLAGTRAEHLQGATVAVAKAVEGKVSVNWKGVYKKVCW